MTAQPQLLQTLLDPGDIVFTPDWVAADMVDFFKPSGRILEPCAGDGVFLKYLPPDTEWCEITKGRDFFAWTEPVDWIVGNPPYKIWDKWLRHSYSISKNILYLIPIRATCQGFGTMKTIEKQGKEVHRRTYGNGNLLGFTLGWPCDAVHFQRGYRGPMYSSIYGESNEKIES